MNDRVELIDVTKGISIILVAFGHNNLSSCLPDLHQTLSLFRLPLFFLLSGVFFSVAIGPVAFALKKADALLKPYFVTLCIVLLFSSIVGEGSLAWKAIGICYGNGVTIPAGWNQMWFLTHLWGLYVAAYFLFRYANLQSRTKTVKIIFVSISILCGCFSAGFFWRLPVTVGDRQIALPGLPWSMDIVFLSLAFFASGAFLNLAIKGFEPKLHFIVGTACLFLFVATSTDAAIDLNMRVYSRPLYATCAAFSGIYLVLSLSYYLCNKMLLKKSFMVLGEASLFILIFHLFLGRAAYEALTYLSDGSYQVTMSFVSLMVAICAPVYIRKLVLTNKIAMLLLFPFDSAKFQQMVRQ